MTDDKDGFLIALISATGCGVVGLIMFVLGAWSSDWWLAVSGASFVAVGGATLSRPLTAIFRNAKGSASD